MSLRMAALTAIVAISAIASAASAQNYPTKPIHLIVPIPRAVEQTSSRGW